jgi:Nuclease A inhibitor-like protein
MNDPSPTPIITTAEVIDRLTEATVDLFWSSESDYPFELVSWISGTELTADGLFNDLDDADLEVESMTLADLFKPVLAVEDWYEAAELAQVGRYRDLLQAIEVSLADVEVFRVGEVEIGVYIVGRTSAGDLVGLKTYVVET